MNLKFKIGEIAYIWVIYGKTDFWSSGSITKEEMNVYVTKYCINSSLGLCKIKIKEILEDSVEFYFLNKTFSTKFGTTKFGTSKCSIKNLIKTCETCKII